MRHWGANCVKYFLGNWKNANNGVSFVVGLFRTGKATMQKSAKLSADLAWQSPQKLPGR